MTCPSLIEGTSFTFKNGRLLQLCKIYHAKLRIKVITKLPNSEQSYKGKVKTHNYINRQNQSTTGKLVYAIICSNCGEFYVSETKTELRTRMTVHRHQTRHQDLTIIRANEHFHDCSGGHFKIFPLYKVNTEGDFLRRKETLLINILKPSLNDK